MRKELYGSTIEKWWCGCPSFQKSPYHICKHLVRLYIGTEGLESNKPTMPFYGQVWRQTTTPILWIYGVHDISLLNVRDLRPNSGLPLLSRYLGEDERRALIDEAEANPPEFDNLLEVLFDSSDEEDADSEDEDVDEEGRRDSGRGGFEDDGGTDEIIQNEMEGEQIKERADLLERRLMGLVHTLQEIRKYPSSHRHLREVPNLNGSVDGLLVWSERRKRVETVRALPTTFGPARQGNVFM